jgi:hypothetical protein
MNISTLASVLYSEPFVHFEPKSCDTFSLLCPVFCFLLSDHMGGVVGMLATVTPSPFFVFTF